MYFDSFAQFLLMGGYAGYVWSAFGITLFALLLLLYVSVANGRQQLKLVRERVARQARIDAAKNMENTL